MHLQSLMNDKKMKLFYDTVSVTKLMRNLRRRLRKRRSKMRKSHAKVRILQRKTSQSLMHKSYLSLLISESSSKQARGKQ